ncbi:uncharacterized protein EDB91DRAFT_835682 [Suillus paluster]|uniref:uncharacterized protein n=1 Tax=Suillus paluster TaxID=48578 RepID=UPI001B871C92|nr:uncharacterized protein EDB91DRAFT_835682 [Suillus paluster]KAG1749127.1 hypothetical protein EDB91DRAFT_835682 [Suillus paluster]
MASQSQENMYSFHQAPRWEHSTATRGAGSSSLESELGNLIGPPHHLPLPRELSSTIQPNLLPSVTSFSAFSSIPVASSSTQPPSLGGSEAFNPVTYTDRQISHHTEYGTRSPHVHQIPQPDYPCAYVDGLPIDEEDLIGGNTNDDWISVHECCRGDSPCGLWVKADRRSIIRHGQRWHRDARGGGDRKIACPWLGCTREMRASDIPRHTLSAHFGATWICRGAGCSKVYTRRDTFKAHSRKCDSFDAAMEYDSSTRVINRSNVSIHHD